METPSLSADGRVVAFATTSNDLAPGANGSRIDVYTNERDIGFTEIASVLTGRIPSDTDIYAGGMSSDGRFVVLDTFFVFDPQWPGGFTGSFVHDRLTDVTERIDLDTGGAIHPSPHYPVMSRDGRVFAFLGDSPPQHLYLRRSDLSVTANDLTGDGDQSDLVLEVVDTSGAAGTATPTPCPADQVAVAHGRTAFRPESSGATPSLPTVRGTRLGLVST